MQCSPHCESRWGLLHTPLTYDQISNLQNWQTGHNYQNGCTYKATIMSTFGRAQ